MIGEVLNQVQEDEMIGEVLNQVPEDARIGEVLNQVQEDELGIRAQFALSKFVITCAAVLRAIALVPLGCE